MEVYFLPSLKKKKKKKSFHIEYFYDINMINLYNLFNL